MQYDGSLFFFDCIDVGTVVDSLYSDGFIAAVFYLCSDFGVAMSNGFAGKNGDKIIMFGEQFEFV